MEIIINYFNSQSPVLQALLASLFTFFITAAGASIVFFFKKVNKNILDAMLGFAAGIMMASSFGSMLAPAIELSQSLDQNIVLTVFGGFLCGGALLFAGDRCFDHISDRFYEQAIKTKSKRSFMLMFSITLHNIPEGLAIGVAFGSSALGLHGATVSAACMLAFGIGLQNFPEGTAISVPLRREGYSAKKSFFIGSMSGIVEPISAVVGAMITASIRGALPFILSFAAGAMIYVVVAELVPESQSNERKELMAMFTLVGFVVMLCMDTTLK